MGRRKGRSGQLTCASGRSPSDECGRTLVHVSDPDLYLPDRVEDLLAQALVTQFAAEALAIPVLPRRSASDALGLQAYRSGPIWTATSRSSRRPVLQFGTIVAADVLRVAVQAHRLRLGLDHASAVDAPHDLQCQARPAVRINQHARAPAVVGLGLHDVEVPDVVTGERPQVFARAVV